MTGMSRFFFRDFISDLVSVVFYRDLVMAFYRDLVMAFYRDLVVAFFIETLLSWIFFLHPAIVSFIFLKHVFGRMACNRGGAES